MFEWCTLYKNNPTLDEHDEEIAKRRFLGDEPIIDVEFWDEKFIGDSEEDLEMVDSIITVQLSPIYRLSSYYSYARSNQRRV